jgi:hypothetical protein
MNIRASQDSDRIEERDREDRSHQTEESNGGGEISDNDNPTIECHGVVPGKEVRSKQSSEADAALMHRAIPTIDERPEVVTFRRRQAQMLPICIPAIKSH